MYRLIAVVGKGGTRIVWQTKEKTGGVQYYSFSLLLVDACSHRTQIKDQTSPVFGLLLGISLCWEVGDIVKLHKNKGPYRTCTSLSNREMFALFFFFFFWCLQFPNKLALGSCCSLLLFFVSPSASVAFVHDYPALRNGWYFPSFGPPYITCLIKDTREMCKREGAPTSHAVPIMYVINHDHQQPRVTSWCS